MVQQRGDRCRRKDRTETTTYVRNIYKYYVAYKLTLEAQEMRRKALDTMNPERPK
jgi:hypothetical protein